MKKYYLFLVLISLLFSVEIFGQVSPSFTGNNNSRIIEPIIPDHYSLFKFIGADPSDGKNMLSRDITVTYDQGDEFCFGTITEGKKVVHNYKFRNVGDIPMLITGAKGSCGCITIVYPDEAIPPGEMGEMEVTMTTRNMKGKQSKRITITANTHPLQSFLTIRGVVLER